MCSITNLIEFESALFSFFILPRQVISLSKDNGVFHCYTHWQLSFPLNLLISLSPKSVTTRLDCCYHQKFNPKPSYFHHFSGGRVAAFHEEAFPIENAKRTAIHHLSLVPRGGSREGVLQKLSDIYTLQPKTAPDQGMLNRYFPSQETLRCWCARICPSYPWLGVVCIVLSIELVRCDTETVTPHWRWLCILHA